MWLSTKNINTNQPSKNSDHQMIDFFQVIWKKNISLELRLPQAIQNDFVVDPNLFQKLSIDLLTNEVNEPALQVMFHNEVKWEVEDIDDARSFQGKIQYWVKWTSWDKNRKLYDDFGLDNFLEIVEDFFSRYFSKWWSYSKKNKKK